MSQKSGMPEWGEDLIKKLDAFLYEKPTRNVMETIDSFFEQAKVPKQIPVDVAETEMDCPRRFTRSKKRSNTTAYSW